MPEPHNGPASPDTVGKRVGRVLLTMGGIAAVAVLVAVSTGAISLPGARDNPQNAETSAQAAVAAERMAANQRWASAMCTNILDWKNEIQRDEAGLGLSFGALARIQDAITTTSSTLNELSKLGLPPAAQTGQARTETDQLRSDIESRLHNIEGAAGSVASGNLAAIGTLLSDLETDKAVGTQVVSELRHVVSVDLGLSLVETGACRQLVGIHI